MRARGRLLSGLCLLGLAALVPGCPEPGAPETGAGPTEPVPEPIAVAPAPVLDPGAVVVVVDGAKVSLHANEALRSDVLRALARETGTTLDVGSSGIEDRRITARIDEAPLFGVLSLLLRGSDYQLDLSFDPVSQLHRVATLRVPPRTAGAAPADTAAPLGGALQELLDSEDPEVVLAVLDALARAGDPAVAVEIEPLLDDPDPALREAAAEALDALEP